MMLHTDFQRCDYDIRGLFENIHSFVCCFCLLLFCGGRSNGAIRFYFRLLKHTTTEKYMLAFFIFSIIWGQRVGWSPLNDCVYPPPRLREWRAKGVSLLFVFRVFPNVVFLCFSCRYVYCRLLLSMSNIVGLVLFVLKGGPTLLPHGHDVCPVLVSYFGNDF